MTTAPTRPTTWFTACHPDQLRVEEGAAILLPDGHQIALFRTRRDHLYAVDNVDPYTNAAVLSRGIVGDHAGEPTIASPMLNNVFLLRTGHSLEHAHIRLSTWAVRRSDTAVQIALPTPRTTP